MTYAIALWVKAAKTEKRPMVTGIYYEIEVQADSRDQAVGMARKSYPGAELRSCAPKYTPAIRVITFWPTVD